MKHVKDHRMLDEDGAPTYLIRIFEGHTDAGVIWAGEFKIYTIEDVRNGVDYLTGSKGPQVPVTEIDTAVAQVCGSVKADGCSNWWIGDAGTAIHQCGAWDLRALLAAITRAHELAAAVPNTGDALESWPT